MVVGVCVCVCVFGRLFSELLLFFQKQDSETLAETEEVGI